MTSSSSKAIRAFSAYLFFFLFIFSENLFAETSEPNVDCGCTVTLKTAADGGIYSDGSAVKPGSKVCIAAGTYKYINLWNYNGTAAAPLKIINCGGQVNVTGYSYAFSISHSSYFTLTGTGTTGITYGFKSSGGATYAPTGMGISTATDFTIDHIDISKSTVGIICKTNPTCDPATWESGSTMRNVVFHDVYVHDVAGEGFYVGHTSSTVNLTCNGVAKSVKPQKINGLKIYKCRVESAGWDGIQIASTPVDAQIYENTVLDFGTKNHSSQQAGILFGGMTNGKVYNNYISNGTGNGIQVFGVGYIEIYNNVVINVGGNNVASDSRDGIFIDDRPVAGYPASYFTVCNNTVRSPKRSGIRMENTHKTITGMSEFHNNLIVGSGEPDANFTSVVVRNGAPNHSTGNLYLAAVSSARFLSSTNCRLNSSSPAINAGVSVSAWGIVKDKDGLNRLIGTKPDAGAYEYSGATSFSGASPYYIVPQDGFAANTSLKIFPNPVTTKFSLQVYNELTGPVKVQVVNISGVLCREFTAIKNQRFAQFNASADGLAAGSYYVSVQIGGWKKSSKIEKL